VAVGQTNKQGRGRKESKRGESELHQETLQSCWSLSEIRSHVRLAQRSDII
jgi:hypothetical protein